MAGIPVKISEQYKPPKKITLPGAVINKLNADSVLPEVSYPSGSLVACFSAYQCYSKPPQKWTTSVYSLVVKWGQGWKRKYARTPCLWRMPSPGCLLKMQTLHELRLDEGIASGWRLSQHGVKTCRSPLKAKLVDNSQILRQSQQ